MLLNEDGTVFDLDRITGLKVPDLDTGVIHQINPLSIQDPKRTTDDAAKTLVMEFASKETPKPLLEVKGHIFFELETRINIGTEHGIGKGVNMTNLRKQIVERLPGSVHIRTERLAILPPKLLKLPERTKVRVSKRDTGFRVNTKESIAKKILDGTGKNSITLELARETDYAPGTLPAVKLVKLDSDTFLSDHQSRVKEVVEISLSDDDVFTPVKNPIKIQISKVTTTPGKVTGQNTEKSIAYELEVEKEFKRREDITTEEMKKLLDKTRLVFQIAIAVLQG